MFPDDRCESCPLTAKGIAGQCMAQTTRHARYCHHAKMGNRGYVAIILGDSQKVEESINVIKNREPLATPLFLGSQPGEAGKERQDDRKELHRIKNCRFLTGCKCGGGRLGDCALGLGNNGKVQVKDCMGCEKWKSR